MRNCRHALVGRGSFVAIVALSGQEPYEAGGRMLVFNGRRRGKPVLFGQIYSAYPFANSFVITFTVKRIRKGSFGTALIATIPGTLRSWGNLTEIEMRLSRRFAYGGQRRSFLSAPCPAPSGFRLATFPLAHAVFGFDGGRSLGATVVRSCRVRR
jgi:hypothetical protein